MASNPLKQFQIETIIPLDVMGYNISFTNHSLWMLLASLIISLIMLLAASRPALVPNRLQVAGESILSFVRALARDIAGEGSERFVPFVLTLFLFLAGVNLIGMIPTSFTATSQLYTTLFMALCVFVIVVVTGIYVQGLGFFKNFLPKGTPWWLAPLMIVLELISFLARPFTLALRLAANMVAGHILLKVFATFVIMVLPLLPPLLIVPLAVNVALNGLEVAVAILQAYIFTILTCVYLHDALHEH